MAEVENLRIIIDVVDSYSEELNHLLFKLGQVKLAAEAVDDITIDVDVRRAPEVEQMARAVERIADADLTGFEGMGDIVMGKKHVSRGGGTVSSRAVGEAAGKAVSETLETKFDELSDSLDDMTVEVDDSARAAKEMADTAEEATEGLQKFDLRMTDIHNAVAKLVPFLLVVVGAIPALVAGFVTLAAAAVAAALALSALTAFGVMGLAEQRGGGDMMEGFREIINEIQRDFLDAFQPLGERLAPLVEDALDGLDRLFQLIANRGDVLVQLTDDAQAFGRWFTDFFPQFLADIGRFADAFGQVFAVFDKLLGMNLARALAGFMAEALPALVEFTRRFIGMIPVVMGLSIGFLRVTSAVMQFFHGIGQILSLIPLTSQQLGFLIGTLLTLATAALVANSTIVSALGSSLIWLGSQSIQFLIGGLVALIEWIFTTEAAVLSLTTAFHLLRGAVIALLAATGIGLLITALGTVVGHFMSVESSVTKATESLRAFEAQQRSMTGGPNPFADPRLGTGTVSGRSRFAGGNVNITVQGNADEETVREQLQNGLYKMERPSRSR